MSEERIIIFDTTLRDGEQSPGASLNVSQKLEIARALAVLGVDVIEAGFPISSAGDFEAVSLVAREVTGPIICGLARCRPEDIDRAAEALKGATRPRIHVFLATSEIHRKFKFKMAREEILKLAVEGARRAKGYVEDVEFSPEDAARTERDFLAQVVEAVIEAGATTVNIPDTVGYAVPGHFSQIIHHLREDVPNIDKAVISVHCHNDLGLAVANSLAAVEAGARQVECTINGLGERAGNAALEELVMVLRTRQDHFQQVTNINTRRIYPTSRLVASLTGIEVQRNKAIVGANAFAHEAGIHVHAVLKEASTYEIMKPEDIGLPTSRLVLGKHSGRHHLKHRLGELGYELSEEQFENVFRAFKELADKKKEVFDEDLEAIVGELIEELPRVFELDAFHISSGSSTIPTATVAILKKDQLVQDAACGDGPVDALYRCMDRITGLYPKLVNYHIRAITGGKDAQGEVSLEVEHDKRSYRAHAYSTDIIDASAKAYLNVLNKIASMKS